MYFVPTLAISPCSAAFLPPVMQQGYSTYFVTHNPFQLMNNTRRNRIDPILAVKDVAASAAWYHSMFGWQRTHGGAAFAVLVNAQSEVQLCLHQWGAHEHPTLTHPTIPVGNGLLLYFCTDELATMYSRVQQNGWPLAESLHRNPNSQQQEFSVRDPDGYFWTVTEFHTFEE